MNTSATLAITPSHRGQQRSSTHYPKSLNEPLVAAVPAGRSKKAERQSSHARQSNTIVPMTDFRDLAKDPKHRRRFEKLLYLAAKRGDADLVAERLSWGIDPNCGFAKGRTPLIANARGSSPSAATVRVLLERGADPTLIDELGLTALDYARRKLIGLQARPARRQPKSPSLDENNQLNMSPEEQQELDRMRLELSGAEREDFLRMWWQERIRAARRVFNDPAQVEQIVTLLEAAGEAPSTESSSH